MPGPNFKHLARIPIEDVVDFLGLDLKKKDASYADPARSVSIQANAPFP